MIAENLIWKCERIYIESIFNCWNRIDREFSSNLKTLQFQIEINDELNSINWTEKHQKTIDYVHAMVIDVDRRLIIELIRNFYLKNF